MKTCAEPRCPELVPKGETYCSHHWKAKRRASDAKRGSSTERGYDARWRRTRQEYLASHPICEHRQGCIAPATDVHHLDGQGPKGKRGHDHSNLQALCHGHHSQITATEQKGGWNA